MTRRDSHTAAVVLACLLLAGCSRSERVIEADYRTFCSPDGKAFFVTPAGGDTSFVRRTPDSDPVCVRKP